MLKDIYNNANKRMDQALDHSRAELSKVRTGRANPDILNSILVDYYGSKMPLNRVSTISIPEPRLISLQPFEKTLIPIIEKAIMDSNLGLTPNNNGNSVLVPIPSLSEERRKDLIKYVHQLIEEGRVSIRNIRKESNESIKKLQKNKEITSDEEKNGLAKIQDHTDKFIELVNDENSNKEKEITKI